MGQYLEMAKKVRVKNMSQNVCTESAVRPTTDAADPDPALEIGTSDDKVKAAGLPQPFETHFPDAQTVAMKDRKHRQLPELLGLVKEGHPNIMLVGPAGTGKTTLASHAAKAMNRNFACMSMSAGITETHLFGR